MFVLTGSVGAEAVMLAVLVSVVGEAGAVSVIATVTVAPRVIAPSEQLTVAVPVQVPCVVEEDTNVAPVGIVSESVAEVVLARPRFVTKMV